MMAQELTIAARRALVAKARRDAGFRARLEQDGLAAIAEATGVALPESMTVELVEEPGAGHFIGVLPRKDALADGLPEPERVRDVWENLLLSTVFLDSEARADLLADPVRYARDLSGNFPGTRFDIIEETASRTYLVLDEAEVDELDEFSLDLIAGGNDVTGGGGNPACVKGSGSSRTTQM